MHTLLYSCLEGKGEINANFKFMCLQITKWNAWMFHSLYFPLPCIAFETSRDNRKIQPKALQELRTFWMSRKGEDQTLLIYTYSTWMNKIILCRWLHIIPVRMTCSCVWIIARSAKYNYMSNLDVLGYTCAENSITCCSYSLSLHQTIRENRINHLMRLVLLFIFVSWATLIFWESLQCVFLVEWSIFDIQMERMIQYKFLILLELNLVWRYKPMIY